MRTNHPIRCVKAKTNVHQGTISLELLRCCIEKSFKGCIGRESDICDILILMRHFETLFAEKYSNVVLFQQQL